MSTHQTTGFVESLLKPVGPDCTQVPAPCHVAGRLPHELSCRGSRGPLHLLVDSTGIMVEDALSANRSAIACRVIGGTRESGGSEGVPHGRLYKCGTRLTWRKIRLGIDEKTLEIWGIDSSPANDCR